MRLDTVPQRSSPAANRFRPTVWLRGSWGHRDLLLALTRQQILVKYKQSIMGFLWAILMPLMIVTAGIVVKLLMARLSNTSVEAESIALVTVKAVPWAFFATAVRTASISLVSNTNLVTKIYMPREVFPFAAVLSQLLDFAVALAALTCILPFIGVELRPQMLWLPVLVFLLVLLAIASGVILSAASLFFRDVKYLVEVFFTFAIFFTPVFYEVSMFGEWAPLFLVNPVAPILEAMGAAVVGSPFPNAAWIAYSAAFATLGFIAAMSAFKRMEPYFAESV